MKKKILLGVGGVITAAALLIGVLSAVKGYFILTPPVKMELIGEAVVEVAAYGEYTDAGVMAYKGKTDLGADVVVQSDVDLTVPGTYAVTYSLAYGKKTQTLRRTVIVVDKEAPVLELLGEAHMKISARKFYEEPGYTAVDRCDGDLAGQVQVTELLEGEKLTLTYTVKDAAGNESSVQRVVTIRDETAPAISLNGKGTVYVQLGGSYQEAGCSAADDVDGDLSAKVVRSGSVDTSSAGTYTICYTVSDRAGNTAEATRTVKVFSYTPNPSDRVYLTFDDGPSTNVTTAILDTLAKHNVKATFFVLNYSQSTKHLIARMINEGHTVAIHGYSHDYATIYANDEAFMQNVYRLRDKLQADFGYNATIIRFPGGSSNTVSKSYNKGIMTRLVQRVEAEGFVYFDWNVSSGDANAAGLSSAQIYSNVTSRLRRGQGNVVLMHDSSAKRTTAAALEDIIIYGKANNYTFLPLSHSTPPVHHGVAN